MTFHIEAIRAEQRHFDWVLIRAFPFARVDKYIFHSSIPLEILSVVGVRPRNQIKYCITLDTNLSTNLFILLNSNTFHLFFFLSTCAILGLVCACVRFCYAFLVFRASVMSMPYLFSALKINQSKYESITEK